MTAPSFTAKRLRLWQELGNDYLQSVYRKPFDWGGANGGIDCCLFAAGMVEAITGVDPMPEFRGQYSDEAGATKALAEIGAGDLKSTLTAKFGDPVPAAHARRFDIGYINERLGVIIGRSVLCLTEPPEDSPKQAWLLVPITRVPLAFQIRFGN